MPPKQLKQKTSSELEQELESRISSIAAKGRQTKASQQASKLKVTFSTMEGVPIDPNALKLLPEEVAKKSHLAIIYRSGSNAIVIVTDPENAETRETLQLLQSRGLTLKIILVPQDALDLAWKRYAALKTATAFEIGAIDIQEDELNRLQTKIKDLDDLRNQIVSISTTSLLEILLAGALKIEASDIHFEPTPTETRIRYRLDGLLQDITNLDSTAGVKILNRVKVLSRMKLNIHHAPQDGRFTIRQQQLSIEVRASVLPSEYGEVVVLRLLDPRLIRSKVEDLGMRKDVLELVKAVLDKPNGAILTTGPTGSGKTTTLYAFVAYLNAADIKIITIEDPIEYHVKGISQTQIDPVRGYTFASGLRAIVRQDPDVILVGEIRDFETADIALQSALTGHLVLSSMHTNDAAGMVPRLIDLGVRPETITPAVSIAIGQRLVRRLCPNCKNQTPLSEDEAKKIKSALEPLKERFPLPSFGSPLKTYTPGKCAQCSNLGYKGRVGIFEVFTMSRAMEKLVLGTPTISEIRDLAVAEGMVTMLQDGYLKVLEGVTSWEEIQRVIG